MRGHQEHLERGYSDAPGCVACGGELDPEGTSEHCARCDAESADAADAHEAFGRADTVPPPAPAGPEGDLFAAMTHVAPSDAQLEAVAS